MGILAAVRAGPSTLLAWSLLGASLAEAAPSRTTEGPRDYRGPQSVPGVEVTPPVLESGSKPSSESPDPQPPEVETGRLRGTVFVYGERNPVPDARVIARDGEGVAEADELGRFELEHEPGSVQFLVRAPGFDDLEGAVELGAGEVVELELRLDPSLTESRYRTVVRQERQVAVSRTRLREDEIRALPGTGGDPLRAVTSLPGATPLAGFLSYVVVRGAAPGNTGYYLDGTRVPILFHVALGPSVVHPAFIESVDFYPAGAPVRLGRYASGIVEATTRRPRRDRVRGDVELRLTDVGGLVEIPLGRPVLPGCDEARRRDCPKGEGRGALTLAGRYSYTAAILSAVQSTAKISYWDYQARFDHRLGAKADLTAFAYGSFDEVGEQPYIDPQTGDRVEPDPFVRFVFHRLDTRVRQRLPGRAEGLYALVLGLDQTGLTEIRSNEWRVAPRLNFRVPTQKNVTWSFGLDQEFQVFRLADALSELEDVEVEDAALLFSDRFVSATGVYVDASIARGRLEVRPGIRADVYVQRGESPYLNDATDVSYAIGVDPRLALREQVAPAWVLKQSVGLYSQPSSFPIPVPGVESFGFERGLQRNLQGSFGYEYTFWDERVSLSQEAYFGYLNNLQDYELEQATGDGFDELEDVISRVDGWSYGLETLLALEPSPKVFGWAAYTLARSVRNYELGGRAPSAWDQRHIFNLVLGYRPNHKWQFGGRLHYHTGRPWTPTEPGQSTTQAFATNRNATRLPPFFQLDLRVERFWRWRDWQLSAYLDVANATYSREVFACERSESEDDAGDLAARMARFAAPQVDLSRGLGQCTPRGFRYVVPALGVRARW